MILDFRLPEGDSYHANATVSAVARGLEVVSAAASVIGRAFSTGLEPDFRMLPILLGPSSDSLPVKSESSISTRVFAAFASAANFFVIELVIVGELEERATLLKSYLPVELP
jgi:hypothetical protein